MMTDINSKEFHIPFIKNLVFIGLVTIVSMFSIHYFVEYLYLSYLPSPIYTSQESQISVK